MPGMGYLRKKSAKILKAAEVLQWARKSQLPNTNKHSSRDQTLTDQKHTKIIYNLRRPPNVASDLSI